MSPDPQDLERARPEADTDALTFSFADPAAQLYGLVRLGLSGTGEDRRGSALGLLFAGRVPIAALAEGDVEVGADAGWEALSLPGVAATTEAPLERWTARMAAGPDGFALTFEATSPPALHEAAGGLAGYEQLCRVHGEVVIGDEVRSLDAVGQRGHAWGAADWTRLESVHTVCAWMRDGEGIALTSARPPGRAGHDEAERWGALLGPDGTLPVADPRLSTTYDGDGRQRRAGLELWIDDEDDRPHRAAGTVLCGSTLELGQLRLDCAFMRWTMDGEVGVGRYDVLRRAAPPAG